MINVAPLTTGQHIVRGDDYRAADGRALTWFSPQWPNLAGATLEMVVGQIDPNVPGILGGTLVTWKGSIPSSPETHTATLELTSTQTKEPNEGCLDYSLTAILADGSRATLAIARLTVQTQPGTDSLLPSP